MCLTWARERTQWTGNMHFMHGLQFCVVIYALPEVAPEHRDRKSPSSTLLEKPNQPPRTPQIKKVANLSLFLWFIFFSHCKVSFLLLLISADNQPRIDSQQHCIKSPEHRAKSKLWSTSGYNPLADINNKAIHKIFSSLQIYSYTHSFLWGYNYSGRFHLWMYELNQYL